MRPNTDWAHQDVLGPTQIENFSAHGGYLSEKYCERLRNLKPGEIIIPLCSRKMPGLATIINESAQIIIGDRRINPHDGRRGFVYASTTGRRSSDGYFRDKTILLHRLLVFGFEGFETAKSFVVHHKDGNTLNNVWDNLEITTQTYNQEVAELEVGSSGYRGVKLETKRNLSRPFRVEIYVGEFKFDQRFTCPLQAAKFYDRTVIDLCVVEGLLHPDRVMARLNFNESKRELASKLLDVKQLEREDLARAMERYRQRIARIEEAWLKHKKEEELLQNIPF